MPSRVSSMKHNVLWTVDYIGWWSAQMYLWVNHDYELVLCDKKETWMNFLKDHPIYFTNHYSYNEQSEQEMTIYNYQNPNQILEFSEKTT